jgi:uncharacterized membrane protein YqjE
MATLTDPPREAFRLSQLIYDTRYRSMTIQVIAFILIMSASSGWRTTRSRTSPPWARTSILPF